MGRKKRNVSYLKPFCYYCEKIFPDEVVLHQHQKSRHFTCQTCKKKFPTASSLVEHMTKNHHIQTKEFPVPHALEGRSSSINIFGMQGVPKSLIEERITSGAQEYWNSIYEEKKRKFAERMKELRGGKEEDEQGGKSIIQMARPQAPDKKEAAPSTKFSFKQAFES